MAQPWHRCLARATAATALALACATGAVGETAPDPAAVDPAAALAPAPEAAPASPALEGQAAPAPLPLEAGPAPAPLAIEARPAPAPLAIEARPAPAPLAIESIARAWSDARLPLGERATRARAIADQIGIASLDPLARAVLWSSDMGSELERARAATVLAPGLPLAHASLAAAEWREGSRLAAARSALASLAALPSHLEAWLWLGATAAWLGAGALALGALAFLLARGVAAARFVAHDLGDALEPSMPGFARFAAVAAVVAVPVAFGEGLAGLALGLVALGFATRARGTRVAVGLAALALVAAIHPFAHVAGERLAAIGADPVARASWSAESGFVDPLDALRLERAATQQGDPLALAAQAEWKRRAGDLAGADAAYAQLVADPEASVFALANAAAVKLAMGEPEAAIDLYRRALQLEPSARLWFNLAQAHGGAIDVEQHDRALAAAQSIDADEVRRLTAQLAGSSARWAAALPLSQASVRERLLAQPLASERLPLRASVAPGQLGRSLPFALVAFALAAALGVGVAARIEPSLGCVDCGAHLCPRCGSAPRGDGRCEACQRRRFEGRGAWDTHAPHSLGERLVRVARFWLPGLLGRGAASAGLAVAIAASGAALFAFRHASLLPDAGSVGGAGSLAFGLAAALCVAAHAGIAVVARRGDRKARA